MLSPVHFPRLEPWWVSYYAFFKWWLLLSLPPQCLRFKTKFDTLSIHFGTLTLVSLVRVSEQELTPCPRFLFKAVCKFWVGKISVSNRTCKIHPYFTSHTSRTRLYWGIFQLEPAIARFDRLFTPNHKSSECMHTTTVQASIYTSINFALLMIRSSGFGSSPSDSRPFRLAFAAAPKN